MRKICLAALSLFAAVNSSQATTVSGSVVYDSAPIGAFGGWTVNFNSTDPTFKLTSINVNVGVTNLFIDTVLTAPGALLPANFSQVSGGAATGFASISDPAGAALDGDTAFTLNFNDFGTGESFAFILDVDECNDLLSFACSQVTGAEFAGATVTFNFSAPGQAYSRTATFIDRVSTGNEYDAIASFEAEVPEPSTWAMIGIGLAGLGLARRKRQA